MDKETGERVVKFYGKNKGGLGYVLRVGGQAGGKDGTGSGVEVKKEEDSLELGTRIWKDTLEMSEGAVRRT